MKRLATNMCNWSLNILRVAVVGLAVSMLSAQADAQALTPHTILVKPGDMPAPYATQSASNGPKIVPKPDDANLALPSGFKAEVFAEGFTNPRTVAVAPNGDVFLV